MKKFISVLLAATFIFVLSACKDSDKNANDAFFDSVTETEKDTASGTEGADESSQESGTESDVSSATDSSAQGDTDEDSPKQLFYTYSDSSNTQAYIFKKDADSENAYFVSASDLSTAACNCMYEDKEIESQVFTIDENSTLTCPCGKTVITKDYLVSVE